MPTSMRASRLSSLSGDVARTPVDRGAETEGGHLMRTLKGMEPLSQRMTRGRAPGLSVPETAMVGAPNRPAYPRLNEPLRALLRLGAARDLEGGATQAEASLQGLAGRVSEAIAASSLGPAGADRLLAKSHVDVGLDTLAGRPGSVDLRLPSALAPEAMLPGLRSEGMRARQAYSGGFAGDVPGMLVAPGLQATEVIEKHEDKGHGSSGGRERARKLSVSKMVEALKANVEGGQGPSASLLHGLVKRLERSAVGGALGRSDIANFTMAWLDRVDGGRTGLDIGLDDLRDEVVSTVGSWAKVRRSRLSMESPIDEARTVGFASPSLPSEDRSGLVRASRRALMGRAQSSRPAHRAAVAMRDADWKFVDTGSRKSTPHADLGNLAAKIMENSPSAGAAPMPLVAPAVKAVAQTALRKGRDESMGADASSSAAGALDAPPGGDSNRSSEAAKLSKAAFEKLALEMADRVARRLKREQERKGQWP